MRFALLATAAFSVAAVAAAQPASPPPPDRWHAKAHELYEHAIDTATVQGRGQVPALANYLAEQYRAAGFTDVTIHRYDVTRPDGVLTPDPFAVQERPVPRVEISDAPARGQVLEDRVHAGDGRVERQGNIVG